jgi:hypothetical protein
MWQKQLIFFVTYSDDTRALPFKSNGRYNLADNVTCPHATLNKQKQQQK